MKILIAGAAGYIGSILVPFLLERRHTITAVDRFYFGDTLCAPRERHPDALRVVRDDVRAMSPELVRGHQAVIDLSGISNDPACELDPDLTESVNVQGGRSLAKMARDLGVRRYVYSSSCSVYGHGDSVGLTENSPRNPVSLYARAKRDLEDSLGLLATEAHGAFDVVILRLATVFGLSPRMRFDLAVNVMARNAYVNHRITVDGGGRQWRPFVHVRDVAHAFALATEADAATVAGEVFNVGSNAMNVQILNLAFRVRDMIPPTEVIPVPSDPDLRNYNVNFDKIHRVLGFKAEHAIEDGVTEVLHALRTGALDPDDRRWNTVRHYRFLADAERAMQELAIDGRLLRRTSKA